jgi:outer membrane receptor for ferrienterochelin and colicins|tara:strand:- start:4560 stop:5021 length:462 start_codon:yes stop_codon:yes gene_type:complete
MILNKSFLVILFLAHYAFGQDSQEVITDSIKEDKLKVVFFSHTKTYKGLDTVPLMAQLISKKDIEQANAIRLSGILNEQTGLITVADFEGGKGIRMLGLDSQYTLILIDGMPLVEYLAGTLDINGITTENIKQLEVVKVPQLCMHLTIFTNLI